MKYIDWSTSFYEFTVVIAIIGSVKDSRLFEVFELEAVEAKVRASWCTKVLVWVWTHRTRTNFEFQPTIQRVPSFALRHGRATPTQVTGHELVGILGGLVLAPPLELVGAVADQLGQPELAVVQLLDEALHVLRPGPRAVRRLADQPVSVDQRGRR